MQDAPPLQQKPSLWQPIAGTLGLTALAALAARLAAPYLDASSLALFFVAPIVVLAIRFRLWAPITAAVLSTAALNYLFVEPRYTFVVARPQDGAALALFAVVAIMVSALAARARADAQRARLRAWEASILRDFARRLGGASDESAIMQAIVDAASRLGRASAALIGADGRMGGASVNGAAVDAAKWCMSTKLAVTPSADAPTDAPWRFWPIVSGGRAAWAIGVAADATLSAEASVAMSQIAAQSGVAFENARITRLAEQARIDAEREKLKSELLAGVSHDLRTPLSTLVLTLQSLQHFAAEHEPQAREELLGLAEQEARRLASLVDTLLDASRLEAGASPVRLETIAPALLVERALAEVDLRGARAELCVGDALPSIEADPALAARAFANILDNALRHGRAQCIRIEAQRSSDGVVFEVSDTGPGLGDDPERLFEKFVRAAPGDGRPPGLGLGLPIARGLVESQGGTLSARNGQGGGAVFRIGFKAKRDG